MVGLLLVTHGPDPLEMQLCELIHDSRLFIQMIVFLPDIFADIKERKSLASLTNQLPRPFAHRPRVTKEPVQIPTQFQLESAQVSQSGRRP